MASAGTDEGIEPKFRCQPRFPAQEVRGACQVATMEIDAATERSPTGIGTMEGRFEANHVDPGPSRIPITLEFSNDSRGSRKEKTGVQGSIPAGATSHTSTYDSVTLMASKTILLRHIMAATPTIYQLLSVGINNDGLEKLEKLSRQFLWGWSEWGNKKASLIVWDRLAQSRAEGGIGWIPIREKSMALQIRSTVKIIQGGAAEWIHLARSLVLRTLRHGQYQRERSQWRAVEELIVLPIGKIKGSTCLSRMSRTWCRVRRMILWSEDCLEALEHITIAHGLHLLYWDNIEKVNEFGKMVSTLRKVGIQTLKDGQQWSTPTANWRNKLAGAGIFLEEQNIIKLEIIKAWVGSRNLVTKDLHEIHGWYWREDVMPFTWEYTILFWTKKLRKKQDFPGYLNEKWGITDTTCSLNNRWKKLWAATLTY
ncbi:hypothetical protein R1sor_014505 [Riccia sorocarpa]|uniref:Uncharacterized protein n=1 Tax=Riccia sorocarpa TaxID=122646 RepID=A0ABD3HDV2_9MARC